MARGFPTAHIRLARHNRNLTCFVLRRNILQLHFDVKAASLETRILRLLLCEQAVVDLVVGQVIVADVRLVDAHGEVDVHVRQAHLAGMEV